MQNRKKKRDSSSQYKGVRQTPKLKASGVWRAEIMTPELGRVFLGALYKSEREAAEVYDAAVAILFGRDGLLNFSRAEVTIEASREAEKRIKWHKYVMKKKAEGYKGRLIYGQSDPE